MTKRAISGVYGPNVLCGLGEGLGKIAGIPVASTAGTSGAVDVPAMFSTGWLSPSNCTACEHDAAKRRMAIPNVDLTFLGDILSIVNQTPVSMRVPIRRYVNYQRPAFVKSTCNLD